MEARGCINHSSTLRLATYLIAMCVLHLLIGVGQHITKYLRVQSTRWTLSQRERTEEVLSKALSNIYLKGKGQPNGEDARKIRPNGSSIAKAMKPCTVLCNKWLFCKPNDVLRYVAAAKRFQRVICSTMRSPYILWLRKGAKRLPLSLRPGGGGIFCTHMVQTINYIHQDGFVGKSARGGSGPNRDDNDEA